MKASKKATPIKKEKPKRKYNNALREQQSETSQKKIIETFVKLLVERRGGEVPIEELSKASGISQRSIFRFFKDKKALHDETERYLQQFLQASVEQIKEKDVLGFARNTFQVFDRHENLVMAYLYSSFGQTAREQFRKKLNQILIQQILKERNLKLTNERKAKLAVIVTLISAKIWHDIKIDFGYSGSEIGDSVAHAVDILIKDL